MFLFFYYREVARSNLSRNLETDGELQNREMLKCQTRMNHLQTVVLQRRPTKRDVTLEV